MKKVRIWATVEVDAFISFDTDEHGQSCYVIDSAVPVRQELMDTPDSDYKLQLYEAVDDQLENERFQAADPGFTYWKTYIPGVM